MPIDLADTLLPNFPLILGQYKKAAEFHRDNPSQDTSINRNQVNKLTQSKSLYSNSNPIKTVNLTMKSSRLIIIVLPFLLVALQLMAAAPVNEAADKNIGQQDAMEKKPAKMGDAKKAGPPKQRGKEEEAQVKADKEKVKSLLTKHRNAMKPKMDEMAKQQAKDEQLQAMLADLDDCKKRNPNEKRGDRKSIAEINEAKAGESYQGDIVLTVEQAIAMFGDSDGNNDTSPSSSYSAQGRKKRAAPTNLATNPSNKWPNAYVPYSFDGSATITNMRSMIDKAIGGWYDNTCLFLQENPAASPRIQFTESSYCRSNIGRDASQTYQELELAPGCVPVGTVSHELGHALGYWHEQSRWDRNDSVWIYLENVQTVPTDDRYNFNIQSPSSNDNMGQPYELNSVMHYDSWSFGKNGSMTLLPKAGVQYIDTPGQSYGPSHYDYIVMNMRYCGLTRNGTSSRNSVNCPSSTTCYNGGFQNPNNCPTCVCPPGYSGTQCSTIQTNGYAPAAVANTCTGKQLLATSTWQDLSGTVGDSTLDSNEDLAYCHWYLTADAGKTLALQVLSVNGYCSHGCVWANTEIRTAADKGIGGLRLCCASDLGPTGQLNMTATNGYAMISLYSFYRAQSFRIRYMQY